MSEFTALKKFVGRKDLRIPKISTTRSKSSCTRPTWTNSAIFIKIMDKIIYNSIKKRIDTTSTILITKKMAEYNLK